MFLVFFYQMQVELELIEKYRLRIVHMYVYRPAFDKTAEMRKTIHRHTGIGQSVTRIL